MLAVGRPVGTGHRRMRLAIAMPALNAESTAARAMACHSTIAARGARSGHVGAGYQGRCRTDQQHRKDGEGQR